LQSQERKRVRQSSTGQGNSRTGRLLTRLGKPVIVSIILWDLSMIATPILLWTAGNITLNTMVWVCVLMQVLAVVTTLVTGVGWRATLLNLIPILPLAWLAEFIGTRTGLPFGSYMYTSGLQPQIGQVPVLVPFAWLMMFPPAWAVSIWVVDQNRTHFPLMSMRLARALVAALAFTVWDLFLDPQMVHWGYWHWISPGVYFGIPLTNYLGWFLVAFLVSFFLAPSNLPLQPLILIYALTWFLSFFGQLFFWGLPGPAVGGMIGMGGMLLWGLVRSRK
jgi:lycopene beta-cyclase